MSPSPFASIEEAIEAIRKGMAKEDFEQEFECKFIAPGGQFISLCRIFERALGYECNNRVHARVDPFNPGQVGSHHIAG
jgi:hypothetical protein